MSVGFQAVDLTCFEAVHYVTLARSWRWLAICVLLERDPKLALDVLALHKGLSLSSLQVQNVVVGELLRAQELIVKLVI